MENGPKESRKTFVFAHGAGLPMDSPWMDAISNHLSEWGARVIRFEFPYMAKRRHTGIKRPPDAFPVLLDCFRNVLEARNLNTRKIFIGGKSMGSRVASLVACELNVRGLVCLGYPFHAPGKEPRERITHLKTLKSRTLIIQGTRDPFGLPEEIASYELAASIEISFLEDGDHNFKPGKKSGFTLEGHLQEACTRIDHFMKRER